MSAFARVYCLSAFADGWAHQNRLGSVVAVSDAAGAPAHMANGRNVSHDFTYDLAGRRISARHDGLTLALSYDAAGRLLSQTHGGAAPVSYAYDAASNVTRLTHPNGWAADFAYDALNRVTAANDNNGAPRTLASVSYDALSRRQSVTYANGTSAQYGYTARGDLTCHDWNLAGAAPSACNVAGAEIAYDFTYNGVGQLVAKALNDPLLKWSPPGNSSDAYVVNGLNQYTDIDGIAPIHDANGNVTTDHRGRTYVYDAENVLRSVSGLGSGTASYRYHADGTRRQKSYNAVVSTFYYTGDQEIAEYDGATLLRRYVRLPGSVDEPFLMIDYSGGSGVESWAHQNRLGSVVAVSDSAGAVATNNKFTYSAYGESGNEGDAGFPFRFTGQKLDAETGLYYYKARYYDPETGRFLQTDPIGYRDQMNLYGYVGNDPVNLFDPTGKCGTREENYQDCPIETIIPEGDKPLTKKEQKKVDKTKKDILKLGKKIAKKGTDEEREAWERITDFKIRPREYHEDQNGPPIYASADGVNEAHGEGPVTIWKPYVDDAAGTRNGRLSILHEVYHFAIPYWTEWRILRVLPSATRGSFCAIEKDINDAVNDAAQRLNGGGRLGPYPCRSN